MLHVDFRRPEDFRADKNRPFTGAEYLETLRHGREVYIDGERVADITTHPAFRNSARSIARLYDAGVTAGGKTIKLPAVGDARRWLRATLDASS